VESARPYATDLSAVLANLTEASSDLSHPAFQGREVKRRAIVLVSSDRGLAGAFNTNLIRAAEERMRERPQPTQLVLLGKKAFDYFRRRNAPGFGSKTDLGGVADWKFAEAASREIITRFEAGELDEVDLIYTRFRSALSRDVVVEPYIPLGSEALSGKAAPKSAGGTRRDYIYEPDPGTILTRIVPYFLAMRLYMALAESAASEHGARMIAMGSARKNAGELIDILVLQRNRLRQAAITKELLDIVGGAEALK